MIGPTLFADRLRVVHPRRRVVAFPGLGLCARGPAARRRRDHRRAGDASAGDGMTANVRGAGSDPGRHRRQARAPGRSAGAAGHAGRCCDRGEPADYVWACSEFAADACLRDAGAARRGSRRRGACSSMPTPRGTRRRRTLRTQPGSNDDAAFMDGAAHLPPPAARAHRVARPGGSRADRDRSCASCRWLADACIDAACRQAAALLGARHGVPQGQERQSSLPLLVLGMGKLGGGELNFSSDIDLVFLFRRARRDGRARGRSSTRSIFVRAGKRVAQLLGTPTDDGFVYRVDLRLRPFGDSGPRGRELRRDRGLPAAARPRLGALRLRQGAPGLRRQSRLRRAVPQRAAAVRVPPLPRLQRVRVAARDEGADRARGRAPRAAAEREARPRRHPRDRVHRAGVPADPRRQHAAAADAQPARGAAAAGGPEAAARPTPWPNCWRPYRFLRRVENRLQEWNDEQTHELPHGRGAPARGSRSRWGCPDWPDLEARARAASATASARTFSAPVFAPGASRLPTTMRVRALEHDPRARARRCAATRAAARVCRLRGPGRAVPARSSTSCARAATTGASTRPAAAACRCCCRGCCRPSRACRTREATRSSRVLHVIERIGGRTVYLALLNENAVARERLVELCAHSQFLADQIAAFPLLLDELLDERLFDPTPTRAELAARPARRAWPTAARRRSRASRSRLLRQFQRAAMFRVAVPDLTGRLPLMKVSDRLTDLAELLVRRSARPRLAADRRAARRAAVADRRTTRCARPGMIVVAYGKFGGIELGYGSDLDLVFLHDSAGEVQRTAGPAGRRQRRVLPAAGAAAGAPADGAFGRRPPVRGRHAAAAERQGRAAGAEHRGLRATTSAREAWTWEHQALLRSRAVAGGAGAARALRVAARRPAAHRRCAATRCARTCARCASGCASELSKSGAGEFDLKQDAGGITDIEFLAQYWTLLLVGPPRGAGDVLRQHPPARKPGLDLTWCRRRPSTC